MSPCACVLECGGKSARHRFRRAKVLENEIALSTSCCFLKAVSSRRVGTLQDASEFSQEFFAPAALPGSANGFFHSMLGVRCSMFDVRCFRDANSKPRTLNLENAEHRIPEAKQKGRSHLAPAIRSLPLFGIILYLFVVLNI